MQVRAHGAGARQREHAANILPGMQARAHDAGHGTHAARPLKATPARAHGARRRAYAARTVTLEAMRARAHGASHGARSVRTPKMAQLVPAGFRWQPPWPHQLGPGPTGIGMCQCCASTWVERGVGFGSTNWHWHTHGTLTTGHCHKCKLPFRYIAARAGPELASWPPAPRTAPRAQCALHVANANATGPGRSGCVSSGTGHRCTMRVQAGSRCGTAGTGHEYHGVTTVKCNRLSRVPCCAVLPPVSATGPRCHPSVAVALAGALASGSRVRARAPGAL